MWCQFSQAIPELDVPVQQMIPEIIPESARQSEGTDSEMEWEDGKGRGVSLSSKY